MKFEVTKTSNWNYKGQIEINTIDELMRFIDKHDTEVVISSGSQLGQSLPRIEIYDTWRE